MPHLQHVVMLLKQGVDLAEVAGKSNDVVRKEEILINVNNSQQIKKQKRHKEKRQKHHLDTKQTSYS